LYNPGLARSGALETPVFESLFQLLFDYRPILFEQGDFRFSPSPGAYAVGAAGLVVIAAAVVSYRAMRTRGRLRDRLVLGSLRVAAFVLVLFCLFRPVLMVRAAVPQQNFLGVLVDDSRSMQITDWHGEPRSAFVRRELGSLDRSLMKALSERYAVRMFRFSSTAARLSSADQLTFAGGQTRLGTALEGARQELAGLPLSGLVLVTDGADTSETSLTQALLALKAASVPVFAVGVGRESLSNDIQIDRVAAPRSILKGTSMLIDVVVTHAGFDGDEVTLDVEDEGRIVGSRSVKLPSDGGPAAVRVRATASEAGPRVFRFRVTPRSGEQVTQNNVRETLIDVRDGREKILYFEGEPRFELKFIRRAVADDKNLQLVSLQRTADNKYLRLDVDNQEELAAGFPKTRDELFSYRGLILGSIEAGAFTGDQLRMIEEFVDRRGGGLLMLGGPRAFGEGGYVGTPVADALPVLFDRASKPVDASSVLHLKVTPTRAGEAQSVTQIAADETASAARWRELPQVTAINPITGVKPGATVLLSGSDERNRSRVVLAGHRYGRGRALAFPIQDSWLWQMHASIPVDDMTHENYWRQLLRWLVDGVPSRVESRTTTDHVDPGEAVTIDAEVVDATFVELNDARVVAHVKRPGGFIDDVPLQWIGERGGRYRAAFSTRDQGLYEIHVEAARAGAPVGAATTYVRATPGDAEFFDATMHAPTLKRIAEETGGRFYTADTSRGLPDDLRYAGRGVTTVEERELWHMPIVLVTLLGLLCAEWGYRRIVGLA
jgi:uncharacterized membrane protein